MKDDLVSRPYRVTFLNLHNGVKHEITVAAALEGIARKAAEAALAQHLAKTAGQPHDWAHYSTAEILASE